MTTVPSRAPQRTRTVGGSITGHRRLLRLGLRRDRFIAPVTLLSFFTVAFVGAYSGEEMFATGENGLVRGLSDNAVYLFFCGAPRDITSGAAFANWEAMPFMVTAAAVCLAMTVVRLTRREEEAGRTELLLAAETGAHAPIFATVLQGVLAAAGIGLVSALPLLTAGATGAEVAIVFVQYLFGGLFGVAVGLVFAEISSTARAANLTAASVVIGCYFLRGVADLLGEEWLRWLSPMGWIQNMDSFGADDVRPGLPVILLLLAAVAGATAIRDRRDLGSGLLARRPGPAAGPRLGDLPAVVARLTATPILTYAAVVAAYGLVVGAILPSIGTLVADNRIVSEIVIGDGPEDRLTPMFVSLMVSLMAMAAAAGGVSLVNRMKAEEDADRAELLLATAVSRTRYYVVHGIDAFVGALVALGLACGAMYLAGAAAGSGWGDTARWTFPAMLAQIPPVLLMTALALALYGVDRRLVSVGWGLVALAFVCGPFFAGFLGIPDWAQQLSPFGHVPAVPVEPMDWTAAIVMIALSAVLFVVGLRAWNRRDV
ncbi:MAG: ABC transporter permease [Gordonia sp. (in: high G+C Gram-positive bacteria)]|uniref:ABC transporter permease n=1 Tax=Gordonia sp. (in: high G+C Gram-positive bacteria) TaxID=84139 RepID=UPI0039E2C525